MELILNNCLEEFKLNEYACLKFLRLKKIILIKKIKSNPEKYRLIQNKFIGRYPYFDNTYKLEDENV